MTTETCYDATHTVDDRYSPPACGELEEIAEVLAEGRLSSGAPVLAIYEKALAGWFGVKRAITVNSGSSALHATLVALGVGHGDEVLVPATAPIPTAMPILTCGAVPVIVDTAPGSLSLDPADVSVRLPRSLPRACLRTRSDTAIGPCTTSRSSPLTSPHARTPKRCVRRRSSCRFIRRCRTRP